MKTHTATNTIEIRENAYGTTPVFGWGWPDEARLAAFAEQAARAEQNDQAKQADRSFQDDAAYVALYFVS